MFSFSKVVALVLALTISISAAPFTHATKCGGFVGIPCPIGQICHVTEEFTSDAFGTCVDPPTRRFPGHNRRSIRKTKSKRDDVQQCDTFEDCPHGFSCDHNIHSPDQPGICIDVADLDEAQATKCGGFVGIPCPIGQFCQVTEEFTSDAFGICVDPPTRRFPVRTRRSKKLQCDTFEDCPHGFSCDHDINKPGKPGRCIDVADLD